jgi:anti-sigma factor RsiW
VTNDGTNTEMTCQELVELVTDYLDDALTTGERRRFEDHLAECEGCQAYLEQLRATIGLMGRLPEPALSPDMESALLSSFRAWADGDRV